jgi:hypothetical protein
MWEHHVEYLMDEFFLDKGDHDRAVKARQIACSLNPDDVRVAGRQRVQMPALELGAVIEGDVEKLGFVGVADVAGVGSKARLVRIAVTVGRESGA